MSPVTLTNGELAIRINGQAMVDQVDFPHLGLESHATGLLHRVAIWADDSLHWLDNGDWTFKRRLIPQSLTYNTVAINYQIGILLEFDDLVLSDSNLLFRNIHVVNLRGRARSLRLYLHQAFRIGGCSDQPDGVYHIDQPDCTVHYRGRRAFLVSGQDSQGKPFDQFSVGRYGSGLDGTWRDAEDNQLSGSSFDQGDTDSIFSFEVNLAVYSSTRLYYWLVAGTSPRGVISKHRQVTSCEMPTIAKQTEKDHRKWLAPYYKMIDSVEPEWQSSFVNCLMSVKSQLDVHGAIVDSSGLCKIQDAAYTLWPLIRLGYTDEAVKFFSFCKQLIDPATGSLLPSYYADGSWPLPDRAFDGSSPATSSEDTALVLFILVEYCLLHPKSLATRDYYQSLVRPMAEYLSGDIDSSTGLASSGSSYATAVSYGALLAASSLADLASDQTSSLKWRIAADDIKLASSSLVADGECIATNLSDVRPSINSLFASYMFGLFAINSPEVQRTADILAKTQSSSGLYLSGDGSVDLAGSLKMAQYSLERGDQPEYRRIVSAASGSIGSTGATVTDKHGAVVAIDHRATSEYLSTVIDSMAKK